MPILVMTDESDRTLARIELFGRRKLTFGRGFERDLVIDDPAVSRLHGVLYREGEDWCIADAGSRTGTVVDGERVRWKRLKPGRTARVGGVRLRIESDNIDGTEVSPFIEEATIENDADGDPSARTSAFLSEPDDFLPMTDEEP